MRTGLLGRTGLEVGVLGLGGAGFLMNLHRETDDAESGAILRRARELGVNYFDSAPLYGGGLSESRLGATLGDDDGAILATKVGAYPGDPMVVDFSAATIRRTVDESRRYLQRDTIDIVQIHELTDEAWDSVFDPGGALTTLLAMQGTGAIRSIGVTSSEPEVLKRAVETDMFDMVQMWRRWNLLDRGGELLLDAAADRGLGVVIGTPLASGVLTGSVDNTYYYRGVPDHVASTVRALQAEATRHDVSLASCALQFCLDERVSVVITGVDSAAQLEQNARDMSSDVRPDVLERVSSLAQREVVAWP